jgi:hypothetical protein
VHDHCNQNLALHTGWLKPDNEDHVASYRSKLYYKLLHWKKQRKKKKKTSVGQVLGLAGLE